MHSGGWILHITAFARAWAALHCNVLGAQGLDAVDEAHIHSSKNNSNNNNGNNNGNHNNTNTNTNDGLSSLICTPLKISCIPVKL